MGKNPLPKNGFGAPGVAGFFLVKKGDGLEKVFENGWGNQSTLQQDVMSLVLLRDCFFFLHCILVQVDIFS